MALLLYFHELFFEGHDSGDAWKILAALAHFRLDIQPKLSNLPRAVRAARGWTRLAPARSKLPMPWPVACLLIQQMIEHKRFQAALATAVGFALYLRPSEVLGLTREQLVPPLRKGGTWAIVLHPFELENPSKTHHFDESITVDSPAFPWLGSLFSALHRRTRAQHWIFSLAYTQWAVEMTDAAEATKVQALGRLTLHQLRHGGAAHELFVRARPLDEIKKRGRWRSDASVQRYAKAGRIQEQMLRLPNHVRAKALHAEGNIGKILSRI